MVAFVQTTVPWPYVGELASLAAAMIWSVSISAFTAFGKALPAQALNLFKNTVAIVCLGLTLLIVHPPHAKELSTYGLLAASGIVGLAIGDTALFAALKHLGAQITSATQCLAPPLTALLAVVFLNESLSMQEAAGLTVTLAAVAAAIYFGQRRGAHLATLSRANLVAGLAFATCGAACQAIGLVLSRFAMQDIDVLSGTAVRIAPAILVLIVMILWRRPDLSIKCLFSSRRQALFISLASFAGTFLGLVLMSMGAKYAKAGIAAALTSSYPVWIIPLARFVLKERVTWQGAACTVLAVGGIILMML